MSEVVVRSTDNRRCDWCGRVPDRDMAPHERAALSDAAAKAMYAIVEARCREPFAVVYDANDRVCNVCFDCVDRVHRALTHFRDAGCLKETTLDLGDVR